jgi:hypothetical protein
MVRAEEAEKQRCGTWLEQLRLLGAVDDYGNSDVLRFVGR